ncbi:glycosyltransferase family 2 protein [Saccharolobus islandicus]|uniref:Glycosyl transferase family 2 n=1 Tax=Saccharolobus islandicus (strain REY15A) TaxID=930945 RepID=F0NDY9_SACI5|nr:glycosyltransferase family 2 protein [Sulfolobus islandicus]ADX84925.1 glycosyl transferase family 2 [Sulfolobus islandicus REY15A]
MSNPKVSVIITAHWRDTYIDKAFESVVSQDFDKKEIEVVLVHRFPYNYKIRKIEEKAGVFYKFISYETKSDPLAFKIKEGVELSKGDIICFLEDDDMFSENKLKSVVTKFNEIENLGYFHNDHYIVDEEGNVLYKSLLNREKSVLIDNQKIQDFGAKFREIFLGKSPQFNSSSICMKRDIIGLDWLGKFTGKRAVDLLLFLMALESSSIIYLSDLKLTYYRIHSQQMSLNLGGKSRYQRALESLKIDEEVLNELEVLKSIVSYDTSKKILDYYFYLPIKIKRYGLINISKKENNVKAALTYLYVLARYIGLREAIRAGLFPIWFHYARELYIILSEKFKIKYFNR